MMTKTPPSTAIVFDLQVAIKRLARRATVMNVALMHGLPLNGIDFIIEPVGTQVKVVHDLIAQAETAGVDMHALHVQIHQPISDELAGIFADLVNENVPDSPEGLT